MQVDIVTFIVGAIITTFAAIFIFKSQLFLASRGRKQLDKALEKALLFAKLDDTTVKEISSRAIDLENGNLKMAFLRLYVDLEASTRWLANTMDIRDDKMELADLFDNLTKPGDFPKAAGDYVRVLRDVRNKVIHGRDVDDGEIRNAIELTSTILWTVAKARPDSVKKSTLLPSDKLK